MSAANLPVLEQCLAELGNTSFCKSRLGVCAPELQVKFSRIAESRLHLGKDSRGPLRFFPLQVFLSQRITIVEVGFKRDGFFQRRCCDCTVTHLRKYSAQFQVRFRALRLYGQHCLSRSFCLW